MRLTGLSDLLRESTLYRDFASRLRDTESLSLNLIRAARPVLLAALSRDWDGPVIYLTPQIRRAYNVAEQLPVWMTPDDPTVYNFTEPTAGFYERVQWGENVIRSRLETLSALLLPDEDSASVPPVVVSSLRSAMQRTMPVNQFRRAAMVIEPGAQHAIDGESGLLRHWLAMGYEATPVVMEPGTFSRRGGVVDIFPVAAQQPVRIEFFGDEVDTLRIFDPATQRSQAAVDRLVITPAREALPEHAAQVAAHLAGWFDSLQAPDEDMTSPAGDAESLSNAAPFPFIELYLPYMYAHPVSLLDYAPDDALIVIEDPDDLQDSAADIVERAEDTRAETLKSGELPPDYPIPYVTWDTLADSFAGKTVLRIGNGLTVDDKSADALGGAFTPGGRFGGQIRPLLTHLRDLRRKNGRVITVTQQAPRLAELWLEQDASEYIPTFNDVDNPPGGGALLFVNGTLTEGWSLDVGGGKAHLLTDAEIFGWSRPEPRRRRAGKPRRPPEATYADWSTGDYVVHVDYGVGQFGGMRHRTIDGNTREYLVISYAENAMVFVPIHQADRLTKYVGADDTPPKLSTLGQQDWVKVRSKARKAVEEEARELLSLYAKRMQASGHAYPPDSHWQHELEASFPYVETDDQHRAVHEVKADMEAGHPMDRLICGDVGFGKTEVALRAAFKAVMEGRQVAVLVPTTVLAQQHYETFTNRLAPFPVKVEMMSRFRTKEQQSRALPKVASGEIDILIGTHRILSKDVTFSDLGLVIIDEEQRFGVKQKEHFKALRAQVDVLTLTATPIPRTLYMSLSGVRDISMIQTPPEERMPVITHVGHFDERLVRQAILREIERGGQVFVVHNRVKSIDMLYDRLADIVPEARIVIGHGQMSSQYLESVMTSFAHGEYDVLLSTSIVESGIDIPNANTLIVDRADWFGMSQLYQLRGRVGRSAQQAYAYFFHAGTRRLTEEARARLDTLAENSGLGAGFQIAMRDLEIRGAGDILSTKQTGHVAAIGLHLYTQLLTQEIKKLKGGKKDDQPAPDATSAGIVIDLPLPAYLPEDWIPEMALRLQIYRRIAGLSTDEQIEAMKAELRDRFGILPPAVEGLLYQMEVKALGGRAMATHVRARDGMVQVKLPYLGEVDRSALALKLGDDVTVTRTAITLPLDDEKMWQLRLLDLLRQLGEGIREGVGI